MPRVYEKMQEKLLEVGAKGGGVRRALVSWAKTQAGEEHRARRAGQQGGGWRYRLAQRWALLQG